MNLKLCLAFLCTLAFAFAPQAQAARKYNSEYLKTKQRLPHSGASRGAPLTHDKVKLGPSYRMPPTKRVKGPVTRRRHG
ncbi:MAG TPA: hypothetical protein VGH90_07385 [Chthoniobacteraceae bacterium]|jgi:hypothetical protein